MTGLKKTRLRNRPEHDSAREVIPPQKDLNLICNAVHSDLEERGIKTLDRADGKMGFLVDQKHKQDVIKTVESRFPGHTPRRPRHRVLRPKSRSWNGGERQGLTGTADD